MTYIVTSAFRYIDIDAYAGISAYVEFLIKQGKKAVAYNTATLNESISKTVKTWNSGVAFRDMVELDNAKFVLIDVSDPKQFPSIINQDNIYEIIDHHPGYEAYWKNLIGKRACIEPVGSAVTLIYERWLSNFKTEQMSQANQRLLITAIIDNTLNFKSNNTNNRDIEAFKQLTKFAKLPKDWPQRYFKECQEQILSDLESALVNDSKVMNLDDYRGEICMGQLVLWEGRSLLGSVKQLDKILSSISKYWWLNVVSVSEGVSYFVARDIAVQTWLSDHLGLAFDGTLATANRMWLRKEIVLTKSI